MEAKPAHANAARRAGALFARARVMFFIIVFLLGSAVMAEGAPACAGTGCEGGSRRTSAKGDPRDDISGKQLLPSHRIGMAATRGAAPVADDALSCTCCSCGAKGSTHATALMSVATWLGSQGGGEEAGGAWPGWHGVQRGVDEDRGAVAAEPSGPVHHHGGWWQGVDERAAVLSGAPGRASTPATAVAAAAHHHRHWEEGRSITAIHCRSIVKATGGGGRVSRCRGGQMRGSCWW